MSLLNVDVMGEGRSRVRIICDGIMFRRSAAANYGYRGTTDEVMDLMGMSIIGPEQAVRAIAAGCSLEHEHQRTTLSFRGPSGQVRARWAWGWKKVTARVLAPGAMHLVAIADEEAQGEDKDGKRAPRNYCIVPAQDTPEGLAIAIYDHLLTKFSTPLIPPGRPGQPELEAATGRSWRRALVSAIVADKMAWVPLLPHPEQTDQSWMRAGILQITPQALDAMVTRMMRAKQLVIPERAA